MRQFDLQPPLCSCGPLAEYFQDQAGPVDDFDPCFFLKIALLDRGQCAVDDQELHSKLFNPFDNRVDLPSAQQGRGTWDAHPQMLFFNNI